MCRFPLLCKIIHTTHVEHFTLGYVAVLLLVAFGGRLLGFGKHAHHNDTDDLPPYQG